MARRYATIPGLAVVLAVTAAASANAQTATGVPAAGGAWDPIQTVNRATYSFNAALSTVIVEPVVAAYRSVVPQAVQTGIDNVFTNLREPLTLLSSGLQGDIENASISVGRFAINTTVGIGGLFDVATEMGWVSRPEDLGATLCSYGVKPGPYIVLPFLGPSTGREAIGLLVTYSLVSNFAEDSTLSYIIADRTVAALSDGQSTTTVAVDPYIAQRDAYLGFRQRVCDDAIPADGLKASPLGGIAQVSG